MVPSGSKACAAIVGVLDSLMDFRVTMPLLVEKARMRPAPRGLALSSLRTMLGCEALAWTLPGVGVGARGGLRLVVPRPASAGVVLLRMRRGMALFCLLLWTSCSVCKARCGKRAIRAAGMAIWCVANSKVAEALAVPAVKRGGPCP
jgi:hypothetical protein